MDTDSQAPLKVLMFPWLAYGHISPFIGLAKNLAVRNFTIYLCSTPVNLQSIKNKITQEYSQSIHLVEFPLEPTPDLPPHLHTTNGLPLNLHNSLRKAVHKAKPNLSKIIDDLKPDLIIYDIHQSWICGLSSKHNIPAVKFLTSCAGMLAYYVHMGRYPGKPFPFPEFYLTDFEQAQTTDALEKAKKDHEDEIEEDEVVMPKRACDKILLAKSSREIEGRYMDYLYEHMGWKVSPFCSLLNGSFNNEDEEHELISWLGTKDENSSIFVSFGSEYFLNKKEMEEIAMGLELSGANFIWVVRFTKESDDSIQNALPEGFLDRVGDKGKVVKGWAPQTRILSHPSIGGFVSHCGWNSLLEAIEIGVPIIAAPMHLDQPYNARIVVFLGVGVEVKRGVDGELKSEAIATAIKDVVGEGKAGEEARRKVRQLGQKLKDEENDSLNGLAEMLKTLSNDK